MTDALPASRIICADALDGLAGMEDGSVQTCVTSPPYWGLRDYGHEGQIGLEPTPHEYVSRLVEVFREVRRVLRRDGTLWLNLGDSYAGSRSGPEGNRVGLEGSRNNQQQSRAAKRAMKKSHRRDRLEVPRADFAVARLKPKDLIGIPWRIAFALQADGWWLRSDIVWAKPNPMPESVTDRPTRSHEYIFLLAKSKRYYYNADAIREPHAESSLARINQATFDQQTGGEKDYANTGTNPNRSARKALENFRARVKTSEDPHAGGRRQAPEPGEPGAFHAKGRNKRDVWTVSTKAFPEAHFATFPPDLIEPCILAGSAPGDTVLDPFCGAGTTGLVSLRHERHFIGIELNPEYADMARARITADAPLLNGAP